MPKVQLPLDQVKPIRPLRKSSFAAGDSVETKSTHSSVKRLSGLKSSVSSIFLNTLFGRPPFDVRTSKLRSKGFVMPGDDSSSMSTAVQRTSSMRSASTQASVLSRVSQRSHIAARSLKSVYSVRSVRRFESTPDIFVTKPTNRGRRSYAVHRGRSVAFVPSTSTRGDRNVRYNHPSVTALIPRAGREYSLGNYSQETLQAPSIDLDSTSVTSIPQTADIAREFPGAVNVKKIARESELDFELAKAAVDGVRPRPVPSKLVDETPLDSYLNARQFSNVPRNKTALQSIQLDADIRTPVASKLSSPSIRKHRQNALLSLCGEADAEAGACPEISASLTPARKSLRKSVPSGSFVLAADSATFLDDREARKSYISIAESYQSADKRMVSVSPSKNRLQYLAYSPHIAFDEDKTSHDALPPRIDSANAAHIHAVYDRIDELQDGLEEIDGSLVGCTQQATRVQSMIMDASTEIYIRPVDRPRLVNARSPMQTQRLSSGDDRFPVFTASTQSLAESPVYMKRKPSTEELKKKEERRRTGGELTDKKYCTPKKSRRAGRPFMGRVLAKLSFGSGK